MSRIVGFGEVMMRLSPASGRRLQNADSLDVFYGGSEANAIGNCADFGDDAVMVSALPDNPLGDGAESALRSHGIDTSYIVREGDRIGVYYMEQGTSIRPSTVVYDRKNSSIAVTDPYAYDFDGAMKGADWFHFSGITPAVSEQGREAVLLACQSARRNGLKISCDVNYRSRMWMPEEAKRVMIPLMEYVDVCIVNEADANNSLGIDTEGHDKRAAITKIAETFRCEAVASAVMEEYSPVHNSFGGVLYYKGKIYETPSAYDLENMTDRTGAGDAMSGGLIHALLKWKDPQGAIEFAMAAASLKTSVRGDMNAFSEEEVWSLMHASGSKGIQR